LVVGSNPTGPTSLLVLSKLNHQSSNGCCPQAKSPYPNLALEAKASTGYPELHPRRRLLKELNENSGGVTDYESQIYNFCDLAIDCQFCDSPSSSFSQHISKRFEWRGGILYISESVGFVKPRLVKPRFGSGDHAPACTRPYHNLGGKHDARRSDSDSRTSDRSSYAWYRSPNAPDCGSGSGLRHARNYTEPNVPDYRDHHNAGKRSGDYSNNVTV